MRFGFWPGASNPWAEVLAVARHAERTGWDRLWFADHFMPNKPVGEDASGEPVHESWTTLAAFASLIPRVRLGHMVSGNTYRHPAVTAKMAAQIDIISGGRFILGLGAAWQENEHHAYGIHFGTLKERMDRFEEACRLITELFRRRRTSFTGEHYQMVDAPLEPKPIQAPLPLMIGGGGEKRTLRITARYASEWNVWGTPEVMVHKQSVLDAHCSDLHRDPSEIQRSACTLLMMTEDRDRLGRARASGRPVLGGSNDEIRQTVQAYIDAGVDEMIIPDFTLGSNARQRTEQMDRFVEEIVPEFRGSRHLGTP
ncbi:MAG: TIGR03560 family F420-dependent LLM class oxidoreductase [Thiotrichales bacterium]|nr:TIGR03560 family F420-dependent LLM class oxidoreductase [Thiotrichales bacterium]